LPCRLGLLLLHLRQQQPPSRDLLLTRLDLLHEQLLCVRHLQELRQERRST
jgi:hypothetical protein